MMNNTDKLLRAFIETSGFDVEEVETFNEAQYLVKAEDYKNNPNDYRGAFCKSPPFKASYIEIDYKVTKKAIKPNSYIKCKKCGTHLSYNSPLDACLCGNSHNLERTNSDPLNCIIPCVPLPFGVQSKEWACIVDFVTAESDNIEHDIGYYGTLAPLWEFMNRNCDD